MQRYNSVRERWEKAPKTLEVKETWGAIAEDGSYMAWVVIRGKMRTDNGF